MYEYKTAKRIADRVVALLDPHCSLIHIAGSIRREKPEVKDIEILCLPKVKFIQHDLFGGGAWIREEGFAIALRKMIKTITKGTIEGRYLQAELIGGMTLDLFMPQSFDYYRILAIRTGPDDYSEKVIAASWVANGWCGTDQGLRRIEDCTYTPSGWKCWRPCPEVPPAWTSERDFFSWLGRPYTEPRDRVVKQSKKIYQ